MKFYLCAAMVMASFFSHNLVLAAQPSNSKKSSSSGSCNKEVFDNCANRLLMLGDDSFSFPTNLDKANERCRELKSLEQCTKDYAKNCLRGDTRNSISVLMYGISKTNKGYCTSNKRKQSLIATSPCLNANKKRLAKYLDAMNRDYHGIKHFNEAKLRIPLACCSYYRFKQTSLKYLGGRCGESVVNEVEQLVDGYAHDVLQLLCGDYTEESDRCSKIIGKTPKWSKPLTAKVFLLPMVDILESL